MKNNQGFKFKYKVQNTMYKVMNRDNPLKSFKSLT